MVTSSLSSQELKEALKTIADLEEKIDQVRIDLVR
jgi:hypothetical protein